MPIRVPSGQLCGNVQEYKSRDTVPLILSAWSCAQIFCQIHVRNYCQHELRVRLSTIPQSRESPLHFLLQLRVRLGTQFTFRQSREPDLVVHFPLEQRFRLSSTLSVRAESQTQQYTFRQSRESDLIVHVPLKQRVRLSTIRQSRESPLHFPLS